MHGAKHPKLILRSRNHDADGRRALEPSSHGVRLVMKAPRHVALKFPTLHHAHRQRARLHHRWRAEGPLHLRSEAVAHHRFQDSLRSRRRVPAVRTEIEADLALRIHRRREPEYRPMTARNRTHGRHEAEHHKRADTVAHTPSFAGSPGTLMPNTSRRASQILRTVDSLRGGE